MTSSVLLYFLFAVFMGSYVQGVTGFALGIVVMALVVGADAIAVAPVAACISILAFVNVLVALHGHYREIDRKLLLGLSVGQVPAIFFGVWLLGVLSTEASRVLEFVLGFFIALGSVGMAVRPKPRNERSRWGTSLVAGAFGGVVGGLFAASGPVTGWYCYRQPIAIATIRATLLAGYFVTTSTRTAIVGASGGLTEDITLMTVSALPVVALGTYAARRCPPTSDEQTLRRGVFVLLFVIGVWIMARAVF